MKDAVESLGRLRIQGLLLLVVVFVVGGVAGAMIGRMDQFRDRRLLPERFDRLPELRGGLPRFFERLDLTQQQEDSIRALFDAHRPIIDSLMAQTMPQIRAVRDSLDVQVVALLTPEQREKYEKLAPRFRFPMGEFRRPMDSVDGERLIRRRGPGPR